MSNIEIDVNALSEVVNDKADRDLGNLTEEGEAKLGKSGGGGGLPPSVCRNMVINTNNSTVNLKWQDPDDTYINGYYLSTWAGTKIVKKYGTYPVNEEDGILVLDNTERNKYMKDFYTVPNAETGYYYSAFPYSTNGVHCYNEKNKFTPAVIYEVCIDPTESNPDNAVTYPAGCVNENFTPMGITSSGGFNYGSWEHVWFMDEIYPCMVKSDTTMDYKLNKNNFNFKEDGTTSSDVANTSYDGNCMIRFPQLWHKWVADNGKYHLYISNVQVDDTYQNYTHINTNGERVNDIYIMAFQPKQIDGKARSLSGVGITVNTAGSTERTAAQANGQGWGFWTYGQWQMLQHLTLLCTKSLDTQSKLGRGRDSNNANNTTGECIDKGMFYGTTATGPMKAWGIENLFANYWKRTDGCCYNNGLLIKLGYGMSDGSTVHGFNTDGSGYVNYGVASGSSGGAISKMDMNTKGLFPRVASGSTSTYYCDGYWFTNGSFASVGGGYANGLLAGLWSVFVSTAFSYADGSLGGSLSCVPT